MDQCITYFLNKSISVFVMESVEVFVVDIMKMMIDKNDLRVEDILERSKGRDFFDIGILGVPFDGSTRGRPGARFAPSCIRRALFSMTTMFNGVSIEGLTIGDFGDVPTYYGSVDLNKKEIYKWVKISLTKCDRLIILGGDHSITEPSFSAFCGEYDNVGLVIFDAHLDMREVVEHTVTSGSVIGDILRRNKDKIDPRNIVYIGIRDFVNPKYYLNKAERMGVTIIRAMDILSNDISIKEVLEKISVALEGVEAIYISLDADSIDQAYAPGVNAPSPLGLRPEHVVQILERFPKNSKCRVLDVTEVAPNYDPIGITCRTAAICIISFISSIKKRR